MRRMGEKREQKTLNYPVTVTDENFEKFVNSHPLVVVDFWAEWCMPCRMIAPIIENLASEYAGKAVFGKLNVDENPKTAAIYRVSSIPTLILFKNGIETERIIGLVPKNHIEAIIEKYL
jgi:thioredoxin 1